MAKDGGAAFPRTSEHIQFLMQTPKQDGMSLRDYYIGQALMGLCSQPGHFMHLVIPEDHIGELAVRLADSALEAR